MHISGPSEHIHSHIAFWVLLHLFSCSQLLGHICQCSSQLQAGLSLPWALVAGYTSNRQLSSAFPAQHSWGDWVKGSLCLQATVVGWGRRIERKRGTAENLTSPANFRGSWERLRKSWFSEVNFTHLCAA